jgi:hypothetical protein
VVLGSITEDKHSSALSGEASSWWLQRRMVSVRQMARRAVLVAGVMVGGEGADVPLVVKEEGASLTERAYM